MDVLGPVTMLWRYPVKSMAGVSLDEVEVGPLGFEHDRRWALLDTDTGRALNAKRMPELLFATVDDDGGPTRPIVTLPDGTIAIDDATLSGWLERRVALTEAQPEQRGQYEIMSDFETDGGEVLSWQGPKGTFHDSNRTQVHLVTTGSIGEWNVRRFRPNIVVDGAGELDLVGRSLHVGSVVLDIVKPTDRCVMTTRPQPRGIERDLDVLRTINSRSSGDLGIGCMVIQPGTIRVGDLVRVA